MSEELRREFPNLNFSAYRITSPKTRLYNCIAWAAGDSFKWWWPTGRYHWPTNVPRAVTLGAFIQAFTTLGYNLCSNANLEEGFEKVAIYTDANKVPTHAARQLSSGRWTSKCGNWEDIEHDLGGLEGKTYGAVACYMRRVK